jgi:hypothetical protein
LDDGGIKWSGGRDLPPVPDLHRILGYLITPRAWWILCAVLPRIGFATREVCSLEHKGMKMDPRVGGAPTSPVYETGASLRMLTGNGGHPRGLAENVAIMGRLLWN